MKLFDQEILQRLLSDTDFQDYVINKKSGNHFFKIMWLKSHPGYEYEFNLAVQCFESLNKRKTHHADAPLQLNKLLERIKKEEKKVRLRGIWKSSNFRYAASIAGILILTILLLFNKNSTKVVVSNFGETTSFYLPDSSLVYLNANSSIEYEEDFTNDKQRKVILKGEAFFDVKKDSVKHFVVVTDEITVKVLGTSFNVASRRGNSTIVLKTGSVELHTKKNEKIIMEPGDLVQYDLKSKTLKVENVQPDQYTSWRRKRLLLEDTPLWEIAQKLEDLYGIKCVIHDTILADRKLTGEFPNGNLDNILNGLTTALEIKFRKEGKSVFFENY